MADAAQSFEVIVDAPLQSCTEVLVDFERYPEWSSPILEARVESRDDAGRGHHVAFALDMRIRTLRYTLAYTYDLPTEISWSLVEGDVSGVRGSYLLESVDDEHTRATCHQEIALGFWVPGPIRRMAERQALRDSVLEFKAEAERRYGRQRA